MIDFILSIFTDIIGLRLFLFNSLICIIVYHFVYKNWSFFSEQNVKFNRGPPFLGAQWRFVIGRESVSDSVIRMYKCFSNEKVFGIFDMGCKPIYFIRDPDLIKQIAIKDFDHFMNHQTLIDSETEPLFGRSLILMRDQRWKSMRSNLSPAFTGSKMRLMFSLIGDVSNSFCDHLKSQINMCGSIECDIREKFGRFSNDAIASCAFGINVDSMKDENNEFYQCNRSLTDFSGFVNLMKFIMISAVPKLSKLLKLRFFKDKDCSYIRKLVKINMDYREKNGIIRNDMINILMQLKRDGTLLKNETETENFDGDIGFATVQESSFDKATATKIQNWDDDDLIGQCMIFIFGGFNTVSLALSFLAHDLTVNPDVQARLYKEISETKQTLNGKPLTYEALQKMKYMDMVVSESMRMWPQVPVNDRSVNNQYELEIDPDHKVTLNADQIIMIPTIAIHRDAKYFPSPDRFDPERFNDENKENIIQGTYMPFGIGPRNCIASRFALMECKACIFHLLSNCKLEMSAKTQHPLRWKKSSGNIEAENGFWMKLVPRV